MVNSKKFKKLIAFISAVCMTSVCMLSVSADTIADNTQSIVQQDETTTIENELLDLGFSQDEVNDIIKYVGIDEVQSILNYTGTEKYDSNISTYADYDTAYHLKDSNGKNINTYTNVSGYNTDGSCGSLASAIMFKYYKDYKGYNIPNCTTANFKNFYYSIKPYVETAKASGLDTIETGLTNFCKDKNINLVPVVKEYNINDSANSLKSKIILCAMYLNKNEPLIATGSYSTSGGHAVVIQGMVSHKNINGDTIGATIEVNNGWGSIEKLDLEEFFTKNSLLAKRGNCGIVCFL